MAFDSTVVKEMYDELPEAQQSEVVDFIMFLKTNLKKPAKKVKPFPFNGLKGKPYYVADDFDEPLDDFKEYM